MIITIELRSGPYHNKHVTKSDMDTNIGALDRAINNKMESCDDQILLDIRSILEVIRKNLPND